MATVNGQAPHGVATCLLCPEACGQTQEGSLVHKHLRAVPGPRWSLCFLLPGELSAGLTPEEPSLSESVQSGLSRCHTAAKTVPLKEGNKDQAGFYFWMRWLVLLKILYLR